MSKCKYCGKPCGLFSNSHRECEKKYENGKIQILQEIRNHFHSADNLNIKPRVFEIAEESNIGEDEIKKLLIKGYDKAVDLYLEDGIISDDEESQLDSFITVFDISDDELAKAGSTQKIVKSVIINEALNGKITKSRVDIEGSLPFIFEKGELICWLFNRVELHEMKTKTHYSGGSQGASIRVTKGVYYRVGAFKGQPIKTEEIMHTATGILVLTDRNLYYSSSNKSLKIKYSQIISMPTFEDAIGIQQARANSKTIYFKNIDIWFMFNLISNLNQN
jgi:hypothetical protein